MRGTADATSAAAAGVPASPATAASEKENSRAAAARGAACALPAGPALRDLPELAQNRLPAMKFKFGPAPPRKDSVAGPAEDELAGTVESVDSLRSERSVYSASSVGSASGIASARAMPVPHPPACDAGRFRERPQLSGRCASDSADSAVLQITHEFTQMASPRAPPDEHKIARRRSVDGSVHAPVAGDAGGAGLFLPPLDRPPAPRAHPVVPQTVPQSEAAMPSPMSAQSPAGGLKRRRPQLQSLCLTVEVPHEHDHEAGQGQGRSLNQQRDAAHASSASSSVSSSVSSSAAATPVPLTPQTPRSPSFAAAAATAQPQRSRPRPPPLAIGTPSPAAHNAAPSPSPFPSQSPFPSMPSALSTTSGFGFGSSSSSSAAASVRAPPSCRSARSGRSGFFSSAPAAHGLARGAPEPSTSAVLPQLLIGSLSALARGGGGPEAGLRACVAAQEVAAVVDCSAQRPGDHDPPAHLAALPAGVAVLALHMRDRAETDAASVFLPAVAFIDRHVRAGKRVLVLCQRGRSRSATVVLAYLIWMRGVGYEQALAEVRAARAAVSPNIGFCVQLLAWADARPARVAPQAALFKVALAGDRCWERAAGEQRRAPVPAAVGPVAELSSTMFDVPPPPPQQLQQLEQQERGQHEQERLEPRCWLLTAPAAETQFLWYDPDVSEDVLRAADQVAALLTQLEGAPARVAVVARGAEPDAFWRALRSAEGKDTAVSPTMRGRLSANLHLT